MDYEVALSHQTELRRHAASRRHLERPPQGDASVRRPSRGRVRRPVALLRLVSHS
ncbi:MAG TPA: hypothetical protein VMD09_15545 [Solirubrobacteraceae bacterium]|nr:hypothetical protein [Solirubrobacteraceae bacterium]